MDQDAEILAAVEASPALVAVDERTDFFGSPGTTWVWAGLASIAVILLPIAGPKPRLATKGAWFWPTGRSTRTAPCLTCSPTRPR